MTAPQPLRWRCRRGMRELDVLLERWLARHWDTATAVERAAFARLLSYPDPLLWDWLVAGLPGPDEELTALCRRIRASV
ncbi:antitoxin CptB [Methylomarinovum caldicuralii]|uniref:FAD assembly factor SdhE n=1 Tax=Methylomarinovum caldicuralii TaxID=438856 RepID=A0AAU9BRA5_9GAMM|nr:succinate dehydrogenase assembly factor 2 [Methylomarinovum caldicuralii]BCX81318.1 antitoxin CptB [Methylomarinovum caldicuralii]